MTKIPAPGKRIRVSTNRQLAPLALESLGDERNERRRRDDADEHEHRNDQRQQRRDGAGDAIRLLLVAAPRASRDTPE